jgi:MFS family permease
MGVSKRWVTILGALAVQALIYGFGVATFTLWAGPWMSTFRASHSAVMAAVMLTHLALGAFSPVAAQLAEKVSIRWLMLGGVAVFCASLWLVSRAVAMWQVTALYAVPVALGMVVTGPMIGQLLAVRLFQPRPGLAIGVVTLGLAAGGLALPPIAVRILSTYGWRDSFAIFAGGIAALALPLILVAIRDRADAPAAASEARSPKRALAPIRVILADRSFIGVTVLVTFLSVSFNGIYYNLGPWMADAGVDPASTARIISTTAIVAAAGIVAFGALADRVDVRLLLGAALTLQAAGMVAAAAGAGPSVLIVTLPLMGFATGGVIPLLPAILANRFGPENFARANGLSLAFTTTAVVGALLAGFGRDVLGDYPAAFRLMLIAFAPCVLGFLALAGPRPVKLLA